jgi:serine/threonine protein kinase
MKKVSTAEQLYGVLERSRLTHAERLAELRGLVQEDPQADAQVFAHELVRRKTVTHWQVRQLLAGRHDFHLGRYKLMSRIAEGGMGSVYMAEEEGQPPRTVAVKVLSQKLVEKPESVARFRREARMAAALKHPNIVAALGADQIGNTHFLVLEYVPGRDLNDWIAQYQRLPIDWSCECIRQGALALQYAHEQGLVHRDIKPANILVCEGPPGKPPVCKLLDMGLARMASETPAEEETELTRTGQIMGTPDYIAPEQAKNTKTADVRADIFSLGCTLFKLITGELPFPGETAMEKLAARFSHDARLASSVRDDVPTRLDLVLARMLARDPAKRYQTPAEVAEALLPFSIGKPEGWKEESSLELPRTDESIGLTPDGDGDADPFLRAYFIDLAMNEKLAEVRSARRWRIIWLLLILALTATGGAAAYSHRQEFDAWLGAYLPQVEAWWQSLMAQ